MRILIVGAGAAGLSLAVLLAESDSGHDVSVIERRRPAERPGFGITVREETLSFLDLNQALPGVHLEGRRFQLAGEVVFDLPNPVGTHLVGFSRASFITTLTERCRRSGIPVRYECDAATLTESELESYDLVVAADGVDSALRRRYQAEFEPEAVLGRHLYGWFGLDHRLPKLTIMAPGNHAAVAWGYMHSETQSTLIVELAELELDRSSLTGSDPEELAKEISGIFSAELGGAQVSCGRSPRWTRFPTVTNAKLWHRNVVLVGDAAHTTHFSQGLGTMFAFDDVLTLHSALRAAGDVTEALELYESSQRPKIVEFQGIASASMLWSESLLDSVARGDHDRARELIDVRWEGNLVPRAPLSRDHGTTPSFPGA